MDPNRAHHEVVNLDALTPLSIGHQTLARFVGKLLAEEWYRRASAAQQKLMPSTTHEVIEQVVDTPDSSFGNSTSMRLLADAKRGTATRSDGNAST